MHKEESNKEVTEIGGEDSDEEDEVNSRAVKRKRAVESDSEEDGSDSDDASDGDEEEDDDDVEDEEDDDELNDNEEEEDDEEEEGESDEEESEEVTDSEDYDSDDEDETVTKCAALNNPKPAHTVAGSDSEGSEAGVSSGEPCAICLGRMKGNIGSPEGCDHSFCLDCILEWSRTNNSCPQDRIPFFLVFVRRCIGGRIIRRVAVEEVKPTDIPPEEEEDPTFCEVCGRCDREDRLLLCDGCDLGYHLECLDPPLARVPIEEWFCSDCLAVNSSSASAEAGIDEGELLDLLEDGAPSSSLPHLRPNRAIERPRLLPRTRASERVRARITRSRQQRAAALGNERDQEAVLEAIAAAEEHEALGHERRVQSSSATSTTTVTTTTTTTKPRRGTKAPNRKRRKVVRKKKRKVKKKRKTTTKKATSTTTKKCTKGLKVKRKTRKTVRRKRKTKRKKKKHTKKLKAAPPPVTAKGRIAEALGIRLSKPWEMVPSMQPAIKTQALGSLRASAALPHLSLLGVNADVDVTSEPDEYGDAILAAGVARRRVMDSQAIARRKALSVRALMSHSSINSRVIKCSDTRNNNTSMRNASDLLGSIMESQSLLLGPVCCKPGGGLKKSIHLVGRGSELMRLNGRVRTSTRTAGPDSPGRHQSGDGRSASPSREQQQSGGSGVDGGSQGASSRLSQSQENDPTGAKRYASYLRENGNGGWEGEGPNRLPGSSYSGGDKKQRKPDEKKKKDEDEEVDIYSDIDPEVPEREYDDDDDDEEDEDEGGGGSSVLGNYKGDVAVTVMPEANRKENEPESSEDELVIDDSDKPECREVAAEAVPRRIVVEEMEENNVVGSSSLPGLNDFELEAVSDTDTPELDKSANSSISLSDSNTGDHEVTSSTNDNNIHLGKPPCLVKEIFGESDEERSRDRPAQPMVGLEGLETETISDNEEISFDDNDDNIEEGEIPSETPRQPTPPASRPRVNLQIRRVIEVSPPRDQEGEYEEGEIVDENAKRKDKKKEKKEKVNKKEKETKEEEKEPEDIEKDKNTMPEVEVPEPVKEPVETPPLEVPEKPKTPPSKQKTKGKQKEKEKDVSFKKVSKNTKERNYRDNDKDDRDRRSSGKGDRGRGREPQDPPGRDRNRDRSRGERNSERGRESSSRRRGRERERKKEPKRKEMERYNVRKMITQKEEERKKKDEFGRDVALRSRSRSRSRRRSRSRSRRRSRSRSHRRSGSRTRKSGGGAGGGGSGGGRRSYSRSISRSRNRKRARRRSYSTSSSSSYTSSSSSSTSSSSSSSRSRGRSRDKRRRRSRSRTRTPIKKKPEKKKAAPPAKPPKEKPIKEKPKKVNPVVEKKKERKKEEKKKDREVEKREETKLEKEKKKKKKEKSPLQSKEVYQAGGSIMVSVSFARAPGKENKEGKKKKEKNVKLEGEVRKRVRKEIAKPRGSPFRSWLRSRSPSPSGKRTPLQDEPMWSPDRLPETHGKEKPPKTPEVIDLDVIMVTPPPQEPILISDSEDEGITRLPPDLGTTPVPPVRPQGPKTPPEPAVKFTLSSKQVLKPINNPLRDEEEEEEPPAPARGPNTPPGPPPESDESVGRAKSPAVGVPHSPAGSPPGSSPEPDVYDPFEPTKSPSPPGSPQQEARVSSSDQTETVEKASPEVVVPPKAASPPPLPTEPPEPEERPPEPQKPPEEEATSTVPPPVTVSTPVATTTTVPPKTSKAAKAPKTTSTSTKTTATATSAPANPINQIFPGLPANVANILYPAALAAAVRGAGSTVIRPQVVQTVAAPDFSRPPPASNPLNRPPPMTIIAPTRLGEKGRVTQNGRDATHTDVVDMDLDSPNSPDSSDVSDMFEPPSPHSTHQSEKSSPRKTRNQAKPPAVKGGKGSGGSGSVGAVGGGGGGSGGSGGGGSGGGSSGGGGNMSDKFDSLFGSGNRGGGGGGGVGGGRKHSTPHKHKAGKKLKSAGKKVEGNEDDIPSSAVDLQVKERFLKKVQRQERVIEEVKLSLKPFYNKKTIGKDDYKEIMRKCVQKVCHNKSGEINPIKIRGLVQGYIKKVKYYRKKQTGVTDPSLTKPSATEPSAPTFILIPKVTKPPTPIKSKA